MVCVSLCAGVERDSYLCDWNVIARYNTVTPVMMGHDVIPCNDGAGYDVVDVIQKGLDDSMIQTTYLYDEAVISYKDDWDVWQ
jgi:hypothetical protein